MTLPLYVDSCQFHLLVNTTQCHILLVAQLSNLSVCGDVCAKSKSHLFMCLSEKFNGVRSKLHCKPKKGNGGADVGREVLWRGEVK